MHPDPAGLAAVDPANPQSWNRYAYVLNNPLALIDPLGLADDGCDPSNNGDQPCPKNVTENDSGGMEGSGCAADGIAISCGWAWSLVYSGAAVPCPNNNCGPVSSQGQLWFFKISTNGNGAYFPVEGPGWNFSSEAEALAAGALWAAAATQFLRATQPTEVTIPTQTTLTITMNGFQASQETIPVWEAT